MLKIEPVYHIHWSELPAPKLGDSDFAEQETYRREVGRLVSESQEGKVVVIQKNEILGIHDDEEAARAWISSNLGIFAQCAIRMVHEWEHVYRLLPYRLMAQM